MQQGANAPLRTLGVPRERAPRERRVAATPETVRQFGRLGFQVLVEREAGLAAGFPDDAYEAAGAELVDDAAELYRRADVIVKVQRPLPDEVESLREGQILIGFLQPLVAPELVAALAERGVIAISMDTIPRITRAQPMDALSSMSTVAGYKAVLLAANELPKFFPLMMTAAGTIRPARVLVLGAGVAGLQAIATARRLGAIVEAFDTRPVVKEQVESLGAKFLELGVTTEEVGGYAKELAEEHLRREQELIHTHCLEADVVITTALVPGRRAPLLIREETVRQMRPRSVIVDLAAEMGGNCELTVPGETIVRYGVTIMGPLNLPSEMAYTASQMYARNVAALIQHLAPKGEFVWNFEDEITRGVVLTKDKRILHEPTLERLKEEVR
ncbi:MAG: Re/Si-specific NAD(P)(+) transhydrogenase subunit alpha [Thermomicrobium sp.]|nr:Re/Si-specific NAD(P)(+) transhydrogenase subunit alpha [Thermomicrobium sp.]MDW8059642.1 Re/Si-specific NAD(P)(+) transhydrogenase subunit alpha [Thermomicrobium sp.]